MMSNRPGFRICAERCDECLFSKDKIVSERRKKEVIRDARQGQGYFICHKVSLRDQNGCCRGFFDSYGYDIQIYQIASRLGFVIWIDAAGDETGEPADAPEWTGRV